MITHNFTKFASLLASRKTTARILRPGFLGMCLLLLATMVSAAEPKPEPFQKGDTVSIVGDSITHGGRYHAFMYLFYATRFPDREVRLINAGISGDSAIGACRRLEWDILGCKPTAATVMLGMNDIGRTSYGKDKTDDKSRKTQEGGRPNDTPPT